MTSSRQEELEATQKLKLYVQISFISYLVNVLFGKLSICISLMCQDKLSNLQNNDRDTSIKWWFNLLKVWRISFAIVTLIDVAVHLFGTSLVLNKEYKAMAEQKNAQTFADYWTLALIAQFCRYFVIVLTFSFIMCNSFIESIDSLRGRSSDPDHILREVTQAAFINNSVAYLSTLSCPYRGLHDTANDETCIICFKAFHLDEGIVVLPCTHNSASQSNMSHDVTRHIFHNSCIVEWTERGGAFCPMCKTPFTVMNQSTQLDVIIDV